MLIQAIKSFLEELVKDSVIAMPAVHLGYLPRKNKDNAKEPEFPYILVRPATGIDQNDCKVTVHLIFGSESEDDQGFLDLFNQMERVRIALLKQPIVDKRFRMELPFKWEFPPEQPEPYTIGLVTTIWTLPTVLSEEGLY
ncbi:MULTISPECIES: hypothetical protein [unclassified Paenibacillus]|uniref:hypothetical protein n=1 Tax=unclassified Paenibacillus TaxID=185978 RepID=UPI0024059CD5|nr:MULTISPECIES: hypothetical protein [unclassified Paenibacillus]MDF9845562.1 hypothetical protein [Paenibacillus sp. PastF-2]MDF9852132.1 hypothetical protein [Paenibacillus sp. PastM-2]MDF9858714.1 hypothetical protein [Paenibacillus sp. PastF-1]MDH6483970.1 hypothetical protein [Paenibacillus sp. PastH-2]MDH6511352.1 hypothetical protein [Paenibacillus sp. PastM-3]